VNSVAVSRVAQPEDGGPPRPQSDSVRTILDSLGRERQRLRSTGEDPRLLEANRLAIVYWERALAACAVAETADRRRR